MFPYSQFLPYCIPFCYYQNVVRSADAPPQTPGSLHTGPEKQSIPASVDQKIKVQIKLPIQQEKNVELYSPKALTERIGSTAASLNTNFVKQTSSTPQKNKEKPGKKPKRPKTYLTERAFYMQQPLKGKQKSDKRILRKRQQQKTKPISKNHLRNSRARGNEGCKQDKGRKPGIKVVEHEKKLIEKIRQKIMEQHCIPTTDLPMIILGVERLNLFCERKMRSLYERMITSS